MKTNRKQVKRAQIMTRFTRNRYSHS